MRALVLLIGLMIPLSCTSPEQVEWTDDRFVNVLVDIHLAEAAAQNLTSAIRDTLLPGYYDQVFQIHGITREEFETVMEELQREPQKLEVLYERIDSVFEVRARENREE